MYICIYVYMYICICICISICISICVCMCTCLFICMYVYTYIRMYVCMYVRINTYVYIYVCMYVCIHTYASIYENVCMHYLCMYVYIHMYRPHCCGTIDGRLFCYISYYVTTHIDAYRRPQTTLQKYYNNVIKVLQQNILYIKILIKLDQDTCILPTILIDAYRRSPTML
jgi:hypothetical protein